MAQHKVKLLIRIRTAEGKRLYCNPVYAANRRLKPLHAVVNGNPEHHPEGVYNLRYLDGKRRVWEPVGNDPNAALAAKLRREHIVRAKDMGIQVVDERKKDDARVTLADAIEKFLVRVRLHRSHKTQKEFVYMLSQFAQVCAKTYLDQVIGDDLLHFAFRLRELGLADRTVANRVARIECFLRANGITGLLASNERPRFDKKVVEAYNEDELKRLFKAANNEERLLFQFFLGSGCREAEVAHATWRDVNFADKTFTVHSKRKQGFGPKDKEERMIPLPDSLVEALKPRRRLYADSHYIFPNKDGRPHGHFLRILKRLVLRAGLNCGECTNRNGLSCRKHPVCDRWELHKFRRTFATMHHEADVSARTLQAWLGHSDLETTLAYLQIADVRSDRTREQVNNSFAAFRAATG